TAKTSTTRSESRSARVAPSSRSLPDVHHRARVTSCGDSGQCAGREFDDERGRSGEGVVFPADCASRLVGKVGERQPDQCCEPPLNRELAARLVDSVFVLVEPDRDAGPQPPDEPKGDAALGLRERVRTGVIHAAQSLPAPREIAIEVDAAAVTSSPRETAVGIEVRDEPEVDPAWRAVFEAPR